MAIFSKFKTKKENFVFNAPVSGKLIEISSVPDEVFAGKVLGDGFAITPASGLVNAPFDGDIVSLFPTNHAIGIKRADGLEVLIHIGVDTVNLKGEGFSGFVKEGDKVKVGQKLVEFDLDYIKDKVPSTDVIIVLTDQVGKEINFDDISFGTDIQIDTPINFI